MEKLIDDNKKAMERIASRAENLAKENTALRQELESTTEKIVLRLEREPKETHVLNDELLHQDEGVYLTDINERIDVLMSVRCRVVMLYL
ncbi:hypothetical protein PINS_up002473 [Pythium insidiosum]|nr:hypothetical protein PINS_up002473 [Pythium insidiosum]